MATQEVSTLKNVVLIDDVYTTGAHMLAAWKFLKNYGIEVADGVVFARTTWEEPESMFKVPSIDLSTDDYGWDM
jgi:orotate phosphoribosyltransferase